MGGRNGAPDNSRLAVTEDFLSRRQDSLRFRHLENEPWLPEVIDDVSPGVVWSNDSRVLYYVRQHPTTLLPWQVWRHQVGASTEQDELIYEEQDETFYVSLHKTSSRQYVVIVLSSTTTSEMLLLDADLANAQPRVFAPRRKDHEYSLDHYQNQFYLRSNRDGKKIGRAHV